MEKSACPANWIRRGNSVRTAHRAKERGKGNNAVHDDFLDLSSDETSIDMEKSRLDYLQF